MNVDAFLKLPPEKRAAPVVLLLGDEPFFKDEALAALDQSLGSPERLEWRGAGGRAGEVAALLDELRTASLFSPVKLVLLREAEAVLSAAPEAVVAHARRRPGAGPRVTLVLDLTALDRRTRVAKDLEREALLVECKRLHAAPPPWARGGAPFDVPLVQWTAARARAGGLAVRPETAHHLTQITGNDLYEIASTLEKVRLSGASELTDADVEALAGRTRRDDAFAVADAVGRRDATRAFESLARVFERGLPDRKGGRIADSGAIGLIVFGRIYAKIGEVRRTLAYLAGGGARSRDAVAAAIGVPPFLAERALADAGQYRGAGVRALYRALLEADLALKGAVPGGGPRAALERLVLRLLNPPPADAKIAPALR